MRKLFRNFADGWIAGLLVLGLTACSQEITDLATTISVTATSVAVTAAPPTVQSNPNVATSSRQPDYYHYKRGCHSHNIDSN